MTQNTATIDVDVIQLFSFSTTIFFVCVWKSNTWATSSYKIYNVCSTLVQSSFSCSMKINSMKITSIKTSYVLEQYTRAFFLLNIYWVFALYGRIRLMNNSDDNQTDLKNHHQRHKLNVLNFGASLLWSLPHALIGWCEIPDLKLIIVPYGWSTIDLGIFLVSRCQLSYCRRWQKW